MEHTKNNREERPTLESVKLSARRNKIVVVVFSLAVLTSACVWAWLSTRQFNKQTVRINQEHLLDIARVESKFLKSLLGERLDYSLEDFTSAITIGEKGYIWIIDANGIIISHPDREQIGKDKMAIRKAGFPGHDWSDLDGIVQRMKKGEEGIGIYESVWWTEHDPEASKKLVGFAPVQVGNTLWAVAACMSFDEITEPIEDHSLRTLSAAGVALLLFSLTGGAFYITQKRENEALQREVAEHKKTKEALEEAQAGLEHRVEQRTAELRRANEEIKREFEERKLAEERVRDLAKFPSEDPNPVLRVSKDKTITYANGAGEQLLRKLGTGFGGELPGKWSRIVEDALDSGLSRQAELEHEERVLSLTLAPITDSGYVNIYGLDVTENRRLQQEILRINDTVQGNIGRDLHDGLLQQLTGLTYFCDTLAENLAEVASPCVDDAHEISEHLRRLTTWIRDLAKGLYPTDLENIGLAPALQRLASTTGHLFSTSVVFECNEPVTISNHQVALHLYRIAQEAVNNAVKHGDAKHIHIGLNRSGDTITLTVKDDGSGFSQEETIAGIGLQSIHFRGKAIGGVVDIQSGYDKGTVVSCSFMEEDKIRDGSNND